MTEGEAIKELKEENFSLKAHLYLYASSFEALKAYEKGMIIKNLDNGIVFKKGENDLSEFFVGNWEIQEADNIIHHSFS